MTQTEALKLALEALELANINHWWGSLKIEEAITAINEALAQPVQLVSWTGNGSNGSAEWREINAPTGYFFPVDGRTHPEERNFCQRCGKRTADLTTIHTCTPPQENT